LPLAENSVSGDVFAGSPLSGQFTIVGNAPKKVLIWAIGPDLGLPGVDDPGAAVSISVLDSSGTVLARDSSGQEPGGGSDSAAAEAWAGAFPLPDGALDSAVIVTLPPGTYTAVASTSGSASGTIVLEVYEIP
jgi:hypothetical protein